MNKVNRYVKKPVTIEAILYDGNNLRDIIEFMGNLVDFESFQNYIDKDNGIFKILTLEGVMDAQIGDYIIKGVKGEFYPCKPDIFELTYELSE